MARGISYSIQRADFSATDHVAASAAELLAILREHNWRAELTFEGELVAAGEETCPPNFILLRKHRSLQFYFLDSEAATAEVFDGVRTISEVSPDAWERMIDEFLTGPDIDPTPVQQPLRAPPSFGSGIPLWVWACCGLACLLVVLLLSMSVSNHIAFLPLVLVFTMGVYGAADKTASGIDRFRIGSLIFLVALVIYQYFNNY